MLIGFRSNAMLARSALMSHPDVDYSKASAALGGLYRDMVMAVDYVGLGRTAADALDEDRKKFVAQYMEMRKRMLRDAKDVVENAPEPAIKQVGNG